jgi:hypothetical protein
MLIIITEVFYLLFDLASSNLINLNIQYDGSVKTPIYKCPIRQSIANKNQIDSSVLVFKEPSLSRLLEKGEETLIISNQANILHKIDYHYTFNNAYTFAYGHMASLEFILKETQTYSIANQTGQFNNINETSNGDEDNVKDETLDQLKSLSKFDTPDSVKHYYFNSNDDTNKAVNNNNRFKCMGKRATSPNGMNTHYLILKQDENQHLLRNLKANDILFSDNLSFNYLERIKNVKEFEVEDE